MPSPSRWVSAVRKVLGLTPPPPQQLGDLVSSPTEANHNLDLIDQAFGRTQVDQDESEGLQDDHHVDEGTEGLSPDLADSLDDLDPPKGPIPFEVDDEAMLQALHKRHMDKQRKHRSRFRTKDDRESSSVRAYREAKAAYQAASAEFSDQLDFESRQAVELQLAMAKDALEDLDFVVAIAQLKNAAFTLERLAKQLAEGGVEEGRVASSATLTETVGRPPDPGSRKDKTYAAMLAALEAYQRKMGGLGGRKMGHDAAPAGVEALKSSAIALAEAALAVEQDLTGRGGEPSDHDTALAAQATQVREDATKESYLLGEILADSVYFTTGRRLNIRQLLQLKAEETNPESIAKELREEEAREQKEADLLRLREEKERERQEARERKKQREQDIEDGLLTEDGILESELAEPDPGSRTRSGATVSKTEPDIPDGSDLDLLEGSDTLD